MRVDNLRLKVLALVGFTLVCVVAFVYLFQQAGGRLRFNKPYTISTVVPDALNIVDNADVRRDGIKIGRVRKIEEMGVDSKITFEIEDKAQDDVYRDATMRVRTKTLVGESYLDLNPGTPAKGKIPDGGLIPLSGALETVPLERILNSLDKPTQNEIRRNLEGIGVGLDGHGDDLNRLFGTLEPVVADGGRLMRVLKPQKEELATLIGQTGVVTGALGERTEALRSLARDAKTTAEAVNTRDARLRETFRELPATLVRAQKTVNVLADFSQRATPTVRDLKLASRDLAPTIQDLGPVSRDARTLFRELNPFLRKFDPVLKQLPPATTKLRTVVGPLDALLRQVNPTADFLKAYSKEFGTFFSNVGSLVGVKDAYGYKGRVFGMAGTQNLTNLSPDQLALIQQLTKVGNLDGLIGRRFNTLPKPGTAGNGQEGDGSYTRVEADK